MDPDLNIRDLSDRYRRGALAPSAVISRCIDSIEALDPTLGAFQLRTFDLARRAASKADAAFARQEATSPLVGIPFAVKDLFDLAGYVTGKGQPRTGQPVARRSATAVARLISAGAIPLGKTKTVEIAMGGWGINKTVGTPWNPWDRTTHRVPGGSSAGSAVAVAAGFAAFALGTDTGGSVRLPAAFCGVTGLCVTAGRLPLDGIMPLSRTLDTPGPIARTVLDAAILFEVMDGRLPEMISYDLSAGTGLCGMLQNGAGLAGVRLGTIAAREREVCTPDVLAAYDRAAETLRGLGANVEDLSPRRSYLQLAETIGALINAEAFAVHGADYDAPDFPASAYVRERLLEGAAVRPETLRLIHDDRRGVQAAFLEDIEGFDAVVTPTTPMPAPPVTEVHGGNSPAHFTRPFNFLGMCGVSVPMGLTPLGLPTGLQIAARAGGEAMALRVAAAYERARGTFGPPPGAQ